MSGVSVLSGERLLVGSYYGEVNGVSTGTVDVMGVTGTGWASMGSLVGTGLVAEAEFGWAVGLDGERALVGAPYQPSVGDLQAWDGIATGCGCPGDVDGDGTVGVNDLLGVLESWGDCPAPCDPGRTTSNRSIRSIAGGTRQTGVVGARGRRHDVRTEDKTSS